MQLVSLFVLVFFLASSAFASGPCTMTVDTKNVYHIYKDGQQLDYSGRRDSILESLESLSESGVCPASPKSSQCIMTVDSNDVYHIYQNGLHVDFSVRRDSILESLRSLHRSGICP